MRVTAASAGPGRAASPRPGGIALERQSKAHAGSRRRTTPGSQDLRPATTFSSHSRVSGSVSPGEASTNGLRLLDLRTECALDADWLRTVLRLVWTQLRHNYRLGRSGGAPPLRDAMQNKLGRLSVSVRAVRVGDCRGRCSSAGGCRGRTDPHRRNASPRNAATRWRAWVTFTSTTRWLASETCHRRSNWPSIKRRVARSWRSSAYGAAVSSRTGSWNPTRGSARPPPTCSGTGKSPIPMRPREENRSCDLH